MAMDCRCSFVSDDGMERQKGRQRVTHGSPDHLTDFWRDFLVTNGPFDAPSCFSEHLATSMCAIVMPGQTCLLDVGCGAGIIGVYCLVEYHARFATFNDIQPEAIAVTRANVSALIAKHRVRAEQVAFSEGSFTDIPTDVVARHNLIVFNAPQMPENKLSAETLETVKSSGVNRLFRLAGADGLDVTRTFLGWYGSLPEAPPAVIQLSSFLGLSRIEAVLGQAAVRYKVLSKKEVPLRDMFCDAARLLGTHEIEDRLLRKRNGSWTKQLLVVSLSRDTEK